MLYIVGLLTDCNTHHPLRNGPTFEKYLSGSSFVLCGVLNVKKVNWSREKSSDDYNDMKLEFLKSKKMIWNIEKTRFFPVECIMLGFAVFGLFDRIMQTCRSMAKYRSRLIMAKCKVIRCTYVSAWKWLDCIWPTCIVQALKRGVLRDVNIIILYMISD